LGVDRGWEFINGAVSGYGTDQQYLFYRNEGHRYRPHEVVLLIYENDLLETSCPSMYGYPKPYFVRKSSDGLELRNVPVPDRTLVHRLHAWLMAHSFLWSYYSYSTGLAVRMDVGCSGKIDFPLNEAVLHAFVEQLRKNDVDFLWVLIPSRPGRQGGVLHEFYPRIARREGVQVLDLAPPLGAAAEGGEELTLWEDPHWNAAGHRLAAAAIAERLACAKKIAPSAREGGPWAQHSSAASPRGSGER